MPSVTMRAIGFGWREQRMGSKDFPRGFGDASLSTLPMTKITAILQRLGNGERDAAELLMREVYGELRKLAHAKMARESPGATLQPTALVHEAWLKLAKGDAGPQFENRRHFFAAAAEAMRRILVDRARRRKRQRHGGGMEKADQELDAIQIAAPDERVLEIHDALEALEIADPLKAKVVKLKYFVGLENKEVAEALDISLSSVDRYWAYSKAWLMKQIRQKTESPKKFKIG